MDSEKTPKWIISGPILGTLKWVTFWTSKTVRLSSERRRYFAYVFPREALLVPPIRKYGPQKMDPKMDPNVVYKTYEKHLYF